MNRVPPKARNIVMVFQDYALYPHMNVYDNMAFGLKLRKASRQEIDRRVHEAVTLLGVGQVVALRLDCAALHLFDAETQQAIASPTREPAAAGSRR